MNVKTGKIKSKNYISNQFFNILFSTPTLVRTLESANLMFFLFNSSKSEIKSFSLLSFQLFPSLYTAVVIKYGGSI